MKDFSCICIACITFLFMVGLRGEALGLISMLVLSHILHLTIFEEDSYGERDNE